MLLRQRAERAVHTQIQQLPVEGYRKDSWPTVFGNHRYVTKLGVPQQVTGARAQIADRKGSERFHRIFRRVCRRTVAHMIPRWWGQVLAPGA
jgi:hypothetical protein